MKKFEVHRPIYSMEELKRSGVDIEEENNIVYACRPGGECEVHDVGAEQLAIFPVCSMRWELRGGNS